MNIASSQSTTAHSHALSNRKINLNPQNTVILAIEFQKTWTRKGSLLHKLIAKPLRKYGVVKKTVSFLTDSRKKGYTVIHAPLVLNKNDKAEYQKMPFMPKLMGAFTKGTWKADFEEDIFVEGDRVAVGRCGFDACQGSNLQQLIREGEFQNVLVAGFLTDQCVEATMKTLQKDGLTCIMVKDCTATITSGIQKKVEKRSMAMSSQELIQTMKAN